MSVSRTRRFFFPVLVLAFAGALVLGSRWRDVRAASAWAADLPGWCLALADRRAPEGLQIADPVIETRIHDALAEFGRAKRAGQTILVDVVRGDVADQTGATAHARLSVGGDGPPPPPPPLVLRLTRSGGAFVVIGYLRPDGAPDFAGGAASGAASDVP